MAESLGMQSAQAGQLCAPASCSNARYLPVARLFQLPHACPISAVWRLLALQNNIRHAGQEEEGGRGRSGEREGGRKLLLQRKKE